MITPYSSREQIVQCGGISSDTGDGGARSSEAKGRSAPDTTGGTGHDNNLVFEVHPAIP